MGYIPQQQPNYVERYTEAGQSPKYLCKNAGESHWERTAWKTNGVLGQIS